MHIDDQLIRLDENLEDITGHLDEQLLNTATVATGDELLTQEQQNFLFAAMPEVCLHFLFTFTEFTQDPKKVQFIKVSKIEVIPPLFENMWKKCLLRTFLY